MAIQNILVNGVDRFPMAVDNDVLSGFAHEEGFCKPNYLAAQPRRLLYIVYGICTTVFTLRYPLRIVMRTPIEGREVIIANWSSSWFYSFALSNHDRCCIYPNALNYLVTTKDKISPFQGDYFVGPKKRGLRNAQCDCGVVVLLLDKTIRKFLDHDRVDGCHSALFVSEIKYVYGMACCVNVLDQ